MIASKGRAAKIDKSQRNEQTRHLSPKTIMVFSNAKDLRRIIQLSFEEIAGWQVFVADLDAQDLTRVSRIQPDVILLDTDLPSSNELQLLQRMQKYPEIQDIPIVLLAERIFNRDRRLYHSLGIVAAIAKPCDMVTLATKISQRLNWNWHRF